MKGRSRSKKAVRSGLIATKRPFVCSMKNGSAPGVRLTPDTPECPSMNIEMIFCSSRAYSLLLIPAAAFSRTRAIAGGRSTPFAVRYAQRPLSSFSNAARSVAASAAVRRVGLAAADAAVTLLRRKSSNDVRKSTTRDASALIAIPDPDPTLVSIRRRLLSARSSTHACGYPLTIFSFRKSPSLANTTLRPSAVIRAF